MLKLITNKDGTETHLVEIDAEAIKVTLVSSGATVALPEMEVIFPGISGICADFISCTTPELINSLTDINRDYVWAHVIG